MEARDKKRRVRRLGALACALALVGGACGQGSSSSSGPQTRTVQVDYDHDEFATSLFEYYPKRLSVRPGDTVEFKQAWTGEPHSVTMGTLVDGKIKPLIALFERIKREGVVPKEEPPEFEPFFQALPFAFAGEDDAGLAQNAAQPCYVDEKDFTGTYPGDAATPCPKRAQPAFNGRQAIYNSGLIPYEGVKGNTFRVTLADDLAPGTYAFYCNLHGPLQYGQLVVKEKGTQIPSNGEVARQAREEAKKQTEPMLRNFRAAKEGKPVVGGDPGDEVTIDAGKSRLIGVPVPFFEKKEFVHGVINEFVPRDVRAKVGEKVTWTFVGGHTISFNVPKYFPIFTIDEKTGTVTFNPDTQRPIGWPGRPEAPKGSEPEHRNEGEEEERGPPPPAHVDVGEWDGRGFHSSGLDFQTKDTFSVTFTRPGTYAYACLIHPQMVGKVVVKG